MPVCEIISDGTNPATVRTFESMPPHRLELKSWKLISSDGATPTDATPSWITVSASAGSVIAAVDEDGDPCLKYQLPVTITVDYFRAWSANVQAEYKISVTVGRADCSTDDKTCIYTLSLANACPGQIMQNELIVVCPEDGYLISLNNTAPYLDDSSDVTIEASGTFPDGNNRFSKTIVDDQKDDIDVEIDDIIFIPSSIPPSGTYNVEGIGSQFIDSQDRTAIIIDFAVLFDNAAPTCTVEIYVTDSAGNADTLTFDIIRGI